ncbi:MAG TPA: CRISPR-associated endonuclease Cas1 [Chromatiales bacterium]|nr:CRISPR-associated endonuclease Cas1 [Chromatiales bacterium]
MALLVLDRKDLELRAEARHVAVYERGQRCYTVPLRMLDRVVVQGRVLMDSAVFSLFAREGVGLVVIDARNPDCSAEIVGDAGSFNRRMLQVRRARDPGWRSAFARVVITRKLMAQWRVLQRFWSARPDLRRQFVRLQRGFPVYIEQIHKHSSSGRRVRAIEGAAARVWFSVYQRLFPEGLGFEGRNRRPPRDPVNVGLSLGYTLLYGEAVTAIRGLGLDPSIGFFHALRPDRKALALDLMEPLRPWVDHWIWRLFRSRTLRPEHFTEKAGRCSMGEAGRSNFYRSWAARRSGFARVLRAYAARLGAALLDR